MLYEACRTPKPRWEQLGPVTQGVWIDKIKDGAKPDDDDWECTLHSTTNKAMSYVLVLKYPKDFIRKVKPKFKIKPKPKFKIKPKTSATKQLPFRLKGRP